MKKFIYGGLLLIVVAAGVNNHLDKSSEQSAAEGAGFESVQEYRLAKIGGFNTKSEYDAYLLEKSIADKQAASDAGFLSVDEYENARRLGMPTKELYDRYLVQQAELKLVEENRKAELKLAEEKRKAELELVEENRKAELKLAEEKRKAELKLVEENLKAGQGKLASSKKIETGSEENTDTGGAEIDTKKISLFASALDYPDIGSPYNEVTTMCRREPASYGNETGHYSCTGPEDLIYVVSKNVFGPDKKLKARFLVFRNRGLQGEILDDTEILRMLDDKFGPRAVTESGSRQFRLTDHSTSVTAVSYGCKAYFLNKPGMDVPGGTPRTHQTIWLETGVVPSLDDAERLHFEIIKDQMKGISKCAVALINYGKFNIPRGINEEQSYIGEVHLLEVDPKFELLNEKHW